MIAALGLSFRYLPHFSTATLSPSELFCVCNASQRAVAVPHCGQWTINVVTVQALEPENVLTIVPKQNSSRAKLYFVFLS